MKQTKNTNWLLQNMQVGWINGRQCPEELTQDQYNLILSCLRHQKARVRWSAASLLGKLRCRKAVEPLIRALKDAYWLVRLHATKALGRIGDSIAIQSLIEMLDDDSISVRRRAVTALGQLNKGEKNTQITAYLIKSLNDPDKDIRARAVLALENSHLIAISAIAKTVSDPNSNVSWRAVDVLRRIGSPAIPELIKLLNSTFPEVRYRAVKTLGYIGNPIVIKSLLSMVDDPNIQVKEELNLLYNNLDTRSNKKVQGLSLPYKFSNRYAAPNT